MSSPVEQELDMSNAEATRAIGDSLNNHILEICNYALYTMIFVATLRQIGRIAMVFAIVHSSTFVISRARRMASSAPAVDGGHLPDMVTGNNSCWL